MKRLWRRFAFLILGVLTWTLLALYPNPAVLLRNIARYRHLPLDPGIEKHMGWDLPNDPASIEFFVDSLMIPTPDWLVYRVPWYVPTAVEAAGSTHGDCESKTILLASLLEGRKIPYEIRASFTHIWVDYQGRKPSAGESRDIAYLEGEHGRLSVHWPERMSLSQFVVIQREQLWDAMPLARKVIWLIGIAWVALGAALLGGTRLHGDLVSEWSAPGRRYASRAFWNWLLVISLIIIAPALWPRSDPIRWQFADLHEVFALSVLSGAFLAWLEVIHPRRSVSTDLSGPRLISRSSFGLWQRVVTLEGTSIRHFELSAPLSGLRAWTIAAALPSGQRLQLLRYSSETAARAALRRLGRELVKPILVRSCRREYWTASDEIPLNLRERAAARPKREQPPRPDDLSLIEQQAEGKWSLGYPRQQSGASRPLLLLASIVVAFTAATTVALVLFPDIMVTKVIWIGAAVLLGMITYGGMALREEILAALGSARVEIADGELIFHDADGRVASVPLDQIESVEIGHKGDIPTIAVVSPERVIHLRLFPQPKHLQWIRGAVEQTVINRAA